MRNPALENRKLHEDLVAALQNAAVAHVIHLNVDRDHGSGPWVRRASSKAIVIAIVTLTSNRLTRVMQCDTYEPKLLFFLM